jgi:hypothetical protein
MSHILIYRYVHIFAGYTYIRIWFWISNPIQCMPISFFSHLSNSTQKGTNSLDVKSICQSLRKMVGVVTHTQVHHSSTPFNLKRPIVWRKPIPSPLLTDVEGMYICIHYSTVVIVTLHGEYRRTLFDSMEKLTRLIIIYIYVSYSGMGTEL